MSEIPSSKFDRTAKFLKTGLKVGGNYLKHYAKNLVNSENDRTELDKNNAEDIYNALSELKGSALKAAQMLSMEQNLLPTAFLDKFAESQYNVPPLSGPLVVKTFQHFFGKSPLEIFDTFDMTATHAASMGQVHRATKGDKVFAVKIQYPGVAESVKSDLNIIRPLMQRLTGWKNEDTQHYFEEVLERLLEETDYALELKRGQWLAKECAHIPYLYFPTYYPEYSCSRILTMDWLSGAHLPEFLAQMPSEEARNRAGQTLWDFYNFQFRKLNTFHADAHPGNFLFLPDGSLGVLDFGCVKIFPQAFCKDFQQLILQDTLSNAPLLLQLAYALEGIKQDDSPEDIAYFMALYKRGMAVLCQPFYAQQFDFGDKKMYDEIGVLALQNSQDPYLRKAKPHGSRHGIYLGRALFGLFQLLHKIEAKVEIQRWKLYAN